MTPLTRLQHRSLYGRSKRNRNAAAHLAAFERLYEQQAQQRRQTVSLMSRAPHDGRPAMVAVPRGIAVNGSETRASETWHSSKHSSSETTAIRGLPLWLTAAFDTATIVRLWPSHVTVFETAASGTETAAKGNRQARQANPSQQRAARLRAAAGTIRMAEQD